MIKIKNRNQYDIIYESLVYCRDHENSEKFTTTKTRFLMIFGGNSHVFDRIFKEILIKFKLIEINDNVDHYRVVYKITQKRHEYIKHYEQLQTCLKE